MGEGALGFGLELERPPVSCAGVIISFWRTRCSASHRQQGENCQLKTLMRASMKADSSLRHGNPVQVALHALAREGVYIGSRAGRNVARGNYPRSWQLQDLLLRRKPMDDTFGHQMARGQWQDVSLAQVAQPTLHKQMFPVPGPSDLSRGRDLCQKRSAALDPENYQTSPRLRA